MRAPAVSSDVVSPVNDTRPMRIRADFSKVWETVEIHVFTAWAHFGRGKRLTGKETINQESSKSMENEAKSAIPQGWKGND